MDPLLSFYHHRVQQQYFSDFPIQSTEQGEYAGTFMKHRIGTRFISIDNNTLATPLCTAPGGQTIDHETLIGLCRVSQSAIILDRFMRSIHLLNFMRQRIGALQRVENESDAGETKQTPWPQWTPKADPSLGTGTLYLPVSLALIRAVSGDHGRVLREILDRLELRQYPFGIVLPHQASVDSALVAEVSRAYHHNGFAVALQREDGAMVPLTF